MYKTLLCLRYLRTRYLAFVCIVSVLLGVATLIVVNSVMSGFSTKLRDRLRGILSDVRIKSDRTDGFNETTEELEAKVAASPVGKHIAATAPTVEVAALLQFTVRRDGRKVPFTRQVHVIGVDPVRQAGVGGFAEYLVRQKNVAVPSFEMTTDALERHRENRYRDSLDDFRAAAQPKELSPVRVPDLNPGGFLENPVIEPRPPAPPLPYLPTPAVEEPIRLPGAILGFSLAHSRQTVERIDEKTGEKTKVQIDWPLLEPGDDVTLLTYGASGTKPASATFVVADYFKAEMSEYDGSFVYVDIRDLQRIRGMGDHPSALQVKLKDDVRNDSMLIHSDIVPALQELLPKPESRVDSWEQLQGPLLAAIDIERGILNILLFLIVGVAGFGVLAIFSMIVSEKFRDIGILKSLGASNWGVMSIFLGYGLLLGVIGCGLGTLAGLWITHHVNEIETWVSYLTGKPVFDRSVYYFDKIPVNVELSSIVYVNLGATAIAVLFSVLPALRAARLQPVRALRFE